MMTTSREPGERTAANTIKPCERRTRAQQVDAAARTVERVVAEHGAFMHAHAMRLCGNSATAQDLVQEALLRVWKRWDRMDEAHGSVRSWLYTVLRNLDVDRRRALSARPLEVGAAEDHLVAVSDDTPSSTVVQLKAVEDRMVLSELMADLPAGQREALAEVYLRDLTHEQAAEALRLPPGTVKSRAFYAMRRLREVAEPGTAA